MIEFNQPNPELRLYYHNTLEKGFTLRYRPCISQDSYIRLQYHNTLEKGFTSRYRPWQIIFVKEYPDKEKAAQVEKKIKILEKQGYDRKIILSSPVIFLVTFPSSIRYLHFFDNSGAFIYYILQGHLITSL